MKIKHLIIYIIAFSFLFSPFVSAQTASEPQIRYQKAKIVNIKREFTKTVNGVSNTFVTLELDVQDGDHKDKRLLLDHNMSVNPALKNELREGVTVVLQSQIIPNSEEEQFLISDMYRLPFVLYSSIFFATIAIFLTGKKGIGAIVGLIISLSIIVWFIVPQILAGRDPLEICIIGSLVILLVTTYLAHGVSKTTSIAVVATGTSLIITYFLAQAFVAFGHLTGLGNEDVYALEMMPGQSINPRGLLLGGIIIGTLGALNDMTVTQVTTIVALWKENQKQSFKKLYKEGFDVGKQHILSLVNTLILAYAGSALPIFVFLVLNPQNLPLWVIVNSEPMSEEIIRSIVGSLGLMLAVPLATLLAAYLASEGFINKDATAHKH